MILADTSAWVEYDRATGSAADRRLLELIDGDGALAVTEPVVMEVCAGARSDVREDDLRRLLTRFAWLPVDTVSDFNAAVTVYRRCRRSGVTPRGLIDCLIAAVALRHGATVIAHDLDFARMAEAVDVALDPASLTSDVT